MFGRWSRPDFRWWFRKEVSCDFWSGCITAMGNVVVAVAVVYHVGIINDTARAHSNFSRLSFVLAALKSLHFF